MKKVLLGLLAGAVLAPCAMANSLSVEGVDPGNPAMEGNFFLQVDHTGGTPVAFVEDATPDGESVYRVEWLYRSRDIAFPNNNQANFRQTIMSAFTNNPNPGSGVCPGLAFVEAIRVFHLEIFGGQVSAIQGWSRGRLCGERNSGTPILIDGPNGVDTDGDGTVRVCVSLTTPDTTAEDGVMSIGVVDDGDTCLNAAFQDRDIANGSMVGPVNQRFGTPQVNGFGLGETALLEFDSVASFRTLPAP